MDCFAPIAALDESSFVVIFIRVTAVTYSTRNREGELPYRTQAFEIVANTKK